jgi:photosystem II stability/assembly factor-like uncharacterized protein
MAQSGLPVRIRGVMDRKGTREPKEGGVIRRMYFGSVRKVHSAPFADSEGGRLVINQMVFCALKEGWAAGSRQVLRSVDGGKTWENKYDNLPSGMSIVPWKIAPVNSAVCWLSEWGPSSRGRLFKTVDGGGSWRSLLIDDRAYPQDIRILDTNSAWVLADSGPSTKLETYLFYTDDGGDTWQQQSVPEPNGTPLFLRFTTDGVGFLVEHRDILKPGPDWSRIYISQDYGRSWNFAMEFDCGLNAFLVDHANRIYVGDDQGNVKKSEDGGRSWVQIAQLNEAVHVVTFDDRGYGFIAGDSESALVSRDWGSSWTEYSFAGLVTAVGDAHFSGNDELVIASTTGIYELNI